MMMDVWTAQLVILACLLVGNIVFGSLPSLLVKFIDNCSNSEDEWRRKIKWATFYMYTGAGIFISDSLLILLPQANKEFSNHSHMQNGNSAQTPTEEQIYHHDSFPMPEFIVLCGFFLAYVIHETAFYLLSKLNKTPRATTDMRVRFCTCAKRHTECSRTYKDAKPDQTLFGLDNNLMASGNVPNGANTIPTIPREVEAPANSELLRSSILAQTVPVPNYGAVTTATEPIIDDPLTVLTPPALLDEKSRIVMEQQDDASHQNKILINSMLIVLALTLQYIFLGIHLELRTEHIDRWTYLLLLCLQTCILTFSAGSYFAVGNMQLSYIALFIGLLSIASPTGFIVEMLKKNTAKGIPHIAKGIVSAVACGTLLYTTFHETLRQKCLGRMVRLIRFLGVITGAGIMISLHFVTLTLS